MDERVSSSRAKPMGDLLVGVKVTVLITRVLEATAAVDDSTPQPYSDDFKPAQIVTLLVYRYAKGIYSSEEVEARLSDQVMACICAGVKPDLA